MEREILAGVWEGVLDWAGLETRVRLEVGEADVLLDLLDLGVIATPLEDLELTERSFAGRLLGAIPLDATLEAGGLALTAGEQKVVLVRDHPRLRLLDRPRPDRLEGMVGRILDRTYPFVDAVLVSQGGELVVEEYFHGTAPEALHTIQSCSKSITSLVFGACWDRGIVPPLDTPVWELFEELRPQALWVREQFPVTIEHALTMTAGLAWEEEVHYTDPRNDNTRMNSSGDWIGYVLDRPLDPDRTPGEAFAYQSGLTILLSGILQAATGRPVDDLAGEYLFEPMGIEHFWWGKAGDGTVHTGGGLQLRPRDFLRLGELVRSGGSAGSERVISEEWMARSTSPQASRGDEGDYGYQWWLNDVPYRDGRLRATVAGGYGGQYLHVVPDLDLVVVSHAKDWFGDGAGGQILADVFEAFAEEP